MDSQDDTGCAQEEVDMINNTESMKSHHDETARIQQRCSTEVS